VRTGCTRSGVEVQRIPGIVPPSKSRKQALIQLLWLAISCAALTACGAANTANPVVLDPSSEEARRKIVRADTWRFNQMERPPSAAERHLTRALQTELRESEPSDAYMCVAREVAAHLTTYAALPDELLQRWMVGRCGGTNVFYWTGWSVAALPPGGLHSELPAELVKNLVPGLIGPMPRSRAFGVGAQAVGPYAVFVLALAEPAAMARTQGPDASGNVRVDGKFLQPVEAFRAIINQGRTGTGSCAVDENVALPEFTLVCKMAPTDGEAWIDIVAASPGAFLEAPVAEVLAMRPDKRSSPYRRPFVRLPPTHDRVQALLAAINALRRRAGIPPLTFEPSQSSVVDAIYPRLFHVQVGIDDVTDEKLRMGLLAGRKVSGIIRSGRICLGIAYAGTAGDWLAARLVQPVSREVLMDPEAEVIALATHSDKAVGFGAAVITYSLFHESHHAPLAEAIYEGLRQERAGHSRSTTRIETPGSSSWPPTRCCPAKPRPRLPSTQPCNPSAPEAHVASRARWLTPRSWVRTRASPIPCSMPNHSRVRSWSRTGRGRGSRGGSWSSSSSMSRTTHESRAGWHDATVAGAFAHWLDQPRFQFALDRVVFAVFTRNSTGTLRG
jgi:hypothetical protein